MSHMCRVVKSNWEFTFCQSFSFRFFFVGVYLLCSYKYHYISITDLCLSVRASDCLSECVNAGRYHFVSSTKEVLNISGSPCPRHDDDEDADDYCHIRHKMCVGFWNPQNANLNEFQSYNHHQPQNPQQRQHFLELFVWTHMTYVPTLLLGWVQGKCLQLLLLKLTQRTRRTTISKKTKQILLK